MKFFSFLFLIFLAISLQGCSWICGFYIANTTNHPITVELKLTDMPGSFPIFHYPRFHNARLCRYDLKKNNSIDPGTSTYMTTGDTLDVFSHYKLVIEPHTAVEIGQLQNDHYEKYDQYFINGRTFNLERIVISEKKIQIVPSTFDNYFKKGKNNGVYFVL